jgi:hypothetical protein
MGDRARRARKVKLAVGLWIATILSLLLVALSIVFFPTAPPGEGSPADGHLVAGSLALFWLPHLV